MKTKLLSLVFLIISTSVFSQIPILNSYPSITGKVIYLDFDGQKVSGTSWNSGNTINAAASTKSGNDIRLIWHRICEDYRPFDVNVTTDSVRFNNAPANKRIRVVFTPTSAWYGSAGGVAYVGSFTWGGTPGTPCWVFENQLSYSVKNMAEAASHEIGHTLTLRHHSIYDAQCTKTAEYNPGVGTGVTSWAPIMGVGYSKNVTIWHFGKNATNCNTIQHDHGTAVPGITSNGFLSFLPDDVGDTYNTAKILNLNTVTQSDSGLISTPGDKDAYRFTTCNTRYISINVKPWALDTNNTGFAGANLDVKLKLFNAANNLLVADSGATKLKALVGMTLPAGSYYFTIDGDSSPNYPDYGSLGKYYVSIKSTNPPTMANNIIIPANVCVAQTTTLNYTSNGTPTNWQWTIAGASSNSFSTQNPTISFNTAGMYTISLLATSGASSSCITSKTIQIASLPNLNVSSSSSVLCQGKTITLMASGATTYTWLPGNVIGFSQIVSPTVNTTYTVSANNGACNNSTTIPITVQPDYTISLSSSAPEICAGTSVTLTASGSTNYTFSPGQYTSNPLILTPTISSNYSVYTTDGVCSKLKTINISVAPNFSIQVTSNDSLLCVGETATINATGASNYILNPGNLNGSSIPVSPSVATTYTIIGSNNSPCQAESTLHIDAIECLDTGIESIVTNEGVSIYPNPANTFIVIENKHADVTIRVYNTLGSLMYTKNINDYKTTLNTKDWAKGVYFVRLEFENHYSITKKIILE